VIVCRADYTPALRRITLSRRTMKEWKTVCKSARSVLSTMRPVYAVSPVQSVRDVTGLYHPSVPPPTPPFWIVTSLAHYFGEL
jgi:hypothetical protein